MSSEAGSDRSSIFRPVSYTSLRNLRHKLSNLFTPPHRPEAAERPLSTSLSLGTLHSEPKRAGDQLNRASASAIRTAATTAARFSVKETLERTQQLSQILFGGIPQLPFRPPTKYTTHSGASGDDSKLTAAQKAQIKAYKGPIQPSSSPTAGSCFDPNQQEEFKDYIKEAMAKARLFFGYPPTLFQHRTSKTELDAADCVLTNVINPVLEICQHWVSPGYKLIVSSQAYEHPAGGVGGYIDHGIFLVRHDCRSLSKGTKNVIVDRLPSSPMEWMAVVVVEEKVFGTIQPKSWNQADWIGKLTTPITPATQQTNQKLYPRSQLHLNEMNTIIESILPQLRKYSDIFKCQNLMLTDYHNSIAISISPSKAGQLDPALPLQVADCGTAKQTWDGDSPLGNVFEYGPRLSFAYLVWHGLTTRKAMRSFSELNKRHRK